METGTRVSECRERHAEQVTVRHDPEPGPGRDAAEWGGQEVLVQPVEVLRRQAGARACAPALYGHPRPPGISSAVEATVAVEPPPCELVASDTEA
jgi:hypothetical protein